MMFQLYVQSSMWLAKTGFGFKMLFIPGAGSVWYDIPSLSLLDSRSESQLPVSLDMTAEQPRLSMLSRLAVFNVFSFTVGLLRCKLIVNPGT